MNSLVKLKERKLLEFLLVFKVNGIFYFAQIKLTPDEKVLEKLVKVDNFLHTAMKYTKRFYI